MASENNATVSSDEARQTGEGALGIGLIGCGRIAQRIHLPILRDLKNARLEALAETDRDPRIAARNPVAEATAFADYRWLLDEDYIDAVVICLPHHLHAEAATAAIEAGKHVYLEKPMAISLDEGRTLAEKAAASDRICRMGFNFRFEPLVGELRDALRDGRAGRILAVRTLFTSSSTQEVSWKQSRTTGGGILLDRASHHADLLRHLLAEEIAEARAETWTEHAEADNALAFFRTAGGVRCESYFSSSHVDAHRMEVYGTQAALTVDLLHGARLRIDDGRFAGYRMKRLRRHLDPREWLHVPPWQRSFRHALAAFVADCQSGEDRGPDFEDGLRSLEAVIAAEGATPSSRSDATAEAPDEGLDWLPSR